MTRDKMSVDQAAFAFALETFVGWRKKPPERRFLERFGQSKGYIYQRRACDMNSHQIIGTRSIPIHVVIIPLDDS